VRAQVAACLCAALGLACSTVTPAPDPVADASLVVRDASVPDSEAPKPDVGQRVDAAEPKPDAGPCLPLGGDCGETSVLDCCSQACAVEGDSAKCVPGVVVPP
jgi:hypothetical protein